MAGLISSLAWYPSSFILSFRSIDSTLVIRVKRGVAQQNPHKYVLDDQELQRVSSLARIELEDAKTELQRAQRAADAVLTRAASGIDEDAEDADDDSAWVE
jgi:periodic tryptophan protein 1